MPGMDGSFEAYVTNLGKYNEGALVGEWVKFPTTEEEMQKVFERIGIGTADEFGQSYEEWFITDYECPLHGVYNMLGEYESLDKLNYLASAIEELSFADQEKLVAIMESGCDEVNDIDDLINLTFNLDCYDILPDVTDEEDLGRYYIEESGAYDLKAMGHLADYIDFERYGRDVADEEGGKFTDQGYVRVESDRWDRQFDGTLDDIPDEYRITGSGSAPERDEKITVLVVEPEKKPYVKEIDSGLESLQHEVGGSIEALYPFEEPVAIVCNEEGKLEGLPLNRCLRDDEGKPYDIVSGTFLITGLTAENFGSLSPELIDKFTELFKQPELFAHKDGKIVVIPMISEEQQQQNRVEQKDFEVNMDTDGLAVSGHIGTWHTIDHAEVEGKTFYLMEHDTYGDEAACIIVDERGKLVLDQVYNGFDDETMQQLTLDAISVEHMPDPSISESDMKDYGYAWGGMLPVREEVATSILAEGKCDVYLLYSDNTEGVCLDTKDIAAHAAKGGIFGIEKEQWVAVLQRENYLKTAEMSTEDDYGMIDGIINNGEKQDKQPDKGEKSSIMDRLKAAKNEPPKDKPAPKLERKGERDL